MTKEEFYRNIIHYNRRIDFCNSIVLLNEIAMEFRKYTQLFLKDDELYKMQIPYNNEFAAVRMRINEKCEEIKNELRKENGYEEFED